MILTYEEQSAQCRLGLLAQHNWDAVFLSGKLDLVALVAEGKEIVALRLLVTGALKVESRSQSIILCCELMTEVL
jgi:hypothetical protein